jgi:5-formaminoimidazole-4-carboxamide-1-beta-D-ribofuranosyl 5'-monophosphate synthetase
VRANFFECKKEKELDESLLSLLEEQLMRMNGYEQRKIEEFSADIVFWEWFALTRFG